MSLLDLLELRPMAEEDRPFVFNSWLRSYRSRCEWAPQASFYEVHHEVVEGLCGRSVVLLAVQKDDPSAIVGWACGEVDGNGVGVVHYVYVKRAFRNCGVARHLVRATVGDCGAYVATHQPAPSLSGRLYDWGWKVSLTLAFYLGLGGK